MELDGFDLSSGTDFLLLAEQNRELLRQIEIVVPARPAEGLNIRLAKLLSVWYGEGIAWSSLNDFMGGFIEATRAKIAWHFKHDRETKYLLMIDSDIEPSPFLPYLLARHDKPIVGGVCMAVSKAYGPQLCFTVKDTEGDWRFPTLLAQNGKSMPEPQMIPRKGLIEVAHVGTGAMLIRRDVIEAFEFTKEDIPFYVDEEIRRDGFKEGNLRRGEDIEFCNQARAKGFQCYVDLEAICGHRKTTALSWPDDQRADIPLDQWRIAPHGVRFEVDGGSS